MISTSHFDLDHPAFDQPARGWSGDATEQEAPAEFEQCPDCIGVGEVYAGYEDQFRVCDRCHGNGYLSVADEPDEFERAQWFVTDSGSLCIHCPCGGNTGDYDICAGCGRQWDIQVIVTEITNVKEFESEPRDASGRVYCPDCMEFDGNHAEWCMPGER